MKKRIISLILFVCMTFGIMSVLSSCGSGGEQAFVIMTDNLDGLFNPFFSTSASDGTIVSMTQIAMLTSATDESGNATVAYGEDFAVVTLDFQSSYNPDEASESADSKGVTTYTFVVKNGIKFSDGHALTIEDVLFNMYVYLDPVYTGSSTMYSTDIQGLSQYRVQQNLSGGGNADEQLTNLARTRASNRINELINVFRKFKNASGTYNATEKEMREAILSTTLSDGYKQAVSNDTSSVTNQHLLEDYERALKLFREELERDYDAAKEAFTEDPYKSTGEFDEITSFMCYEGFVKITWGDDADGKPNADRSTIKEIERQYSTSVITDRESAINHVFNSKIEKELHVILSAWGTATELQNLYLAQAKEVILKQNMKDGELLYPNISGIVSLGHTTDVESVTIGEKTYKVAHEHNEDGTPANPDEYDVLQIKINGIDPKAVWNFAFAVAPQHYYAEGYEVDIENNRFGVEYASFSFMTESIQSQRNVTLPMGAGAYMATNNKDEDNVSGTEFFNSNVVYFKANPYFEEGLEASLSEGSTTDYKVNIEKVRYQVVPTTDAITMLQSGTVHYVTPQLTKENKKTLDSMSADGFETISSRQLGYGYIGINAAYVPNIYLRRAIMAAMDTSLALQYYEGGTAEQIFWPMSTVSWAYPKDESGNNSRYNGHDYPVGKDEFSEGSAKEKVLAYMKAAKEHPYMEFNESTDLKITFTIAGSNLTDHPTYQVFQTAAKILNDCGWEVEVIADSQALVKLSTGSLAVWAAAWGTTVDPDMYQVYHKNSNASSVRAWGYNAILSNSSYTIEQGILNQMSEIIDKARETDVRDVRTELYEQAMGYVLDLAIELPVYQRDQLYAYNGNVLDPTSFPEEINPYSSPLDRIWEIRFNENAKTNSMSGGISPNAMFIGGFGVGFVAILIVCITVSKKRKKHRLAYVKSAFYFDEEIYEDEDDYYDDDV